MGSSERPTFFRPRKRLAFTLTEVVIAASILAIFVVGAVSTMVQINRWAESARLRTLATALVQQQIDQVMTTSWSVLNTTPPTLWPANSSSPKWPVTAGTQKVTTENSLPLNNDPFNSETGLSSAFTNLDVQVIDTRTTTVTAISSTQVRAVVAVSYTYRSRQYTISMTTLRTTDDF